MNSVTDITQSLEDRLVEAWKKYNNPASHEEQQAAKEEIENLHSAIMKRSLKEHLK